jgi:hypothetical protein
MLLLTQANPRTKPSTKSRTSGGGASSATWSVRQRTLVAAKQTLLALSDRSAQAAAPSNGASFGGKGAPLAGPASSGGRPHHTAAAVNPRERVERARRAACEGDLGAAKRSAQKENTPVLYGTALRMSQSWGPTMGVAPKLPSTSCSPGVRSVEFLLQRCCCYADCRDSQGRTPLMLTALLAAHPPPRQVGNGGAAAAAAASVAAALLRAGASVGATDFHGNTPLHFAYAHCGSFGAGGGSELLSLLMAAGARPSALNFSRQSPKDVLGGGAAALRTAHLPADPAEHSAPFDASSAPQKDGGSASQFEAALRRSHERDSSTLRGATSRGDDAYDDDDFD